MEYKTETLGFWGDTAKGYKKWKEITELFYIYEKCEQLKQMTDLEKICWFLDWKNWCNGET